ncbi:MAG: hypothetical protein ACRD32_05275, partial [Nitrososphaerales archaeon]
MFEVIKSKIGSAKLSDSTIIYLRLVIVDIKEDVRLPVGFNLAIGNQVTISVESPKQMKSKVSDKPFPPRNQEHLRNFDIWHFVDIVDTKPS